MLATTPQDIEHLLALARDRSDEARVELTTKITTLMSSDQILTMLEVALVEDLLDVILERCGDDARAKIAERLGAIPDLPRSLALALACGPQDISKPIVASNINLMDQDLISIIHVTESDVRQTIAARKAVSEAVADALILTGDFKVMEVLLDNFSARLSDRGMVALAEAARYAESLRVPLLQRPELNQDQAKKIYWFVSSEMRRFILSRYGFDHGQIDAALEKTISDMLRRAKADKNDEAAMAEIASWMAGHDTINAKTLTQVLRLGYHRLFCHLLAEATELPISQTDLIVSDLSGRALAVVARMMRMEKSSFVSLFLLSSSAQIADRLIKPQELYQALATFDRIAPDIADHIVASWRQSPAYLETRLNSISFV